jgi:hypothetical protein
MNGDGPPRKSARHAAGQRFSDAVRPASLLRKSILDMVGRLHRRADRTATFKLRARRCQEKYIGISKRSENDLETMKHVSLLKSGQIA